MRKIKINSSQIDVLSLGEFKKLEERMYDITLIGPLGNLSHYYSSKEMIKYLKDYGILRKEYSGKIGIIGTGTDWNPYVKKYSMLGLPISLSTIFAFPLFYLLGMPEILFGVAFISPLLFYAWAVGKATDVELAYMRRGIKNVIEREKPSRVLVVAPPAWVDDLYQILKNGSAGMRFEEAKEFVRKVSGRKPLGVPIFDIEAGEMKIVPYE